MRDIKVFLGYNFVDNDILRVKIVKNVNRFIDFMMGIQYALGIFTASLLVFLINNWM